MNKSKKTIVIDGTDIEVTIHHGKSLWSVLVGCTLFFTEHDPVPPLETKAATGEFPGWANFFLVEQVEKALTPDPDSWGALLGEALARP